jgi:DNA replication and repair protein RecF
MATQTRSHVTDQKPSLTLDTLRVEGVRNLESATFRPGPRLNVVFGLNGHGKTTVLEAIYVAATTRSFRTSRLRDLVAHGASTFSIQASFTERRADLPPLTRTQSAVFSEGKLHARLDGQKPPTLADFAVRSPVVVFHPEELALSTGPAALRRRLLDRVALYRAPTFAASLNRYAKALKSRQELLRRGASTHELEAYEQLLATAGAEIVRARRRAHLAIEPAVLEAFARIAAPGLELKLDYRTSGEDDEQVCARELAARRDRDRRAITAGFGPHRDDLELRLGGKLAREVASQGQHRAITLSLKAAESVAVREITGLEPIQLLDDVSSELDGERTAALLGFLSEMRGQVFVTTTRPELVTVALRSQNPNEFQIVSGQIKSA